MGINKVTMNTPEGEQTLIDLTDDSVAPETLAKGATAHNAAGDLIEGKMPIETVLFIPQVLSQEEQAQARNNIGVDPAGTANLKLEEAKTYTDEEIEKNKVLTVTQENFSFQEIVNASNSGRVVQAMRNDGILCSLVLVADDEGAVFVTTDGIFVHAVIVTTDNQWMEQDQELANADEYYNKSEIDENHYSKSEIDETLATFGNDIETILAENFFNKDTVIEFLRLKADKIHRHHLSEIDDFNEYMIEHNDSATAHQNIRNLIPTKISELTNDKGYLTQHQSLAGYATETYVGNTVSTHNTATTSHSDIRELITGLTTRLNTLANSDDTTLDQMSEVVAYIKNNRTLIEGITTNKVNVSDIINNLTTNVSNKPLSAAQGVVIKGLIDAVSTSLSSYALKTELPTKLSQLSGDSTHRVVTDAEKAAWDAKSDFSGKYEDLSGKPTIPTVPTKVSAFTNDAGYITGKDKGIYYIEGTGDTAGTWLGTHADIQEYTPGLTVLYKIPVAGASPTTLNINNLGAVTVVKNVSTAISTNYAVGCVIMLTYTIDSGTAYFKIADYDANTKTSAGTSNKTGTKMFLVGAQSQTSSGTTTYTNTNCYIGTDNRLYSGGKVVPNTDEIDALIDAKIAALPDAAEVDY